MKKNLLFIFALVFSFVGVQSYAQQMVPKLPVIEQFTQASCGPCAQQNPGFNALLDQYEGELVTIKYQTWFPGVDPMYSHNPNDVTARAQYYGINAVPNVVVEGTNLGVTSQVTPTILNNLTDDSTTIQMNLSHAYNSDYNSVDVQLDVINWDTVDFEGAGRVLHLVMIEKEIVFDEAPGSNGETEFISVMRDMVLSPTGMNMQDIAAGDTLSMNWTVTIPAYIYEVEEIGFVSFIQNTSDRTSVQGAESLPVEVTDDLPDLAIVSVNAETPDGFCDNQVPLTMTVANEGDVEITSFTAILTDADGNLLDQVNWTGSLMIDEEATVDFGTITTGVGLYVASVSVLSDVNGLRDENTHNQSSVSFANATVSDDIVYEDGEFEKGFDNIEFRDDPEGVIVLKSSELHMLAVERGNLPSPPSGLQGAYGNSLKSMLVYFWNMPAGTTATMLFEKTSLEGYENAVLTFDRAYAQADATSNDGLLVLVSKDCGLNWDVVFDKSGAELATTTPKSSFYSPATSDWVTDSIFLSEEYDDADEILIALQGVSAFGNNLYFDNVKLSSSLIIGVNQPTELSGVSAFPNPISDYAYIDLSMTTAATVNMYVYNATGGLMQTVVEGQQVAAGQHRMRIDATGLQNGVYFVKVQTETGETTKRIVVAK